MMNTSLQAFRTKYNTNRPRSLHRIIKANVGSKIAAYVDYVTNAGSILTSFLVGKYSVVLVQNLDTFPKPANHG